MCSVSFRCGLGADQGKFGCASVRYSHWNPNVADVSCMYNEYEIQVKCSSCVVHARFKCGSSAVQARYKCGPNVVQVWCGCGS
eukprot:5671560-Pyramimonas_sp.AAC.1